VFLKANVANGANLAVRGTAARMTVFEL